MENIKIKETKNYLMRYKKNMSCIRRLEKKLEILDKRLKSPRTTNLSGMPRGGVPVTIADLVADKENLERRIQRLKIKGANLKSEVLEEIDKLNDSRYIGVLEAFFIDDLSLEIIAENEGYTVRHIYRLYSEAVNIIAKTRQ